MDNFNAYIQSNGACPYCGCHKVLIAREFEDEYPPHGDKRLQCSECNREWYEIFKLVDIEPVEDLEFANQDDFDTWVDNGMGLTGLPNSREAENKGE